MVNGVQNVPAEGKFPVPMNEEKTRPYGFHPQGIDEYVFDQRFDVFGRGRMVSLLNDDPVLDGDFSSRNQKNQGRKGHNPQSSQLDKNHIDDLAEGSEVRRRVLDRQTGHTYRRCRPEKGIHQGDMSGVGAERKKENSCSDADDR